MEFEHMDYDPEPGGGNGWMAVILFAPVWFIASAVSCYPIKMYLIPALAHAVWPYVLIAGTLALVCLIVRRLVGRLREDKKRSGLLFVLAIAFLELSAVLWLLAIITAIICNCVG